MALWIVATPIGTLGDLSPRAREVLGSASVIAAEDTRTTRKLLSAVAIAAPELVALHAHNESQRVPWLVERAQGEQVVLVSDAGTPAVSDPGQQLVAAALAAGVELRSVPGPSALAAALAVAGFPVAPCMFLGFAPRKGRASWAREALAWPHTFVIYEAPTRVPALLAALAECCPQRPAVVCRELSKRYEQVVRDSLVALAARPAPRGECVVVVGPGEVPVVVQPTLEAGASLKQVAAVLAERWGVSKREAYQRLIALD